MRTRRDGEVRIGDETQMVTIPSLAAPTGSGPRFVTTDSTGLLTPTSFTVDDVLTRIDETGDRADEGTALALAVGGLVLPPDGRDFALSGSVAGFGGQSAAGMSLAGRLLSEPAYDLYLQAGAGVGLDSGRAGGRVGLALAW